MEIRKPEINLPLEDPSQHSPLAMYGPWVTYQTSGIVPALGKPYLTSDWIPILKLSSKSVLQVAWNTEPASNPSKKLYLM